LLDVGNLTISNYLSWYFCS